MVISNFKVLIPYEKYGKLTEPEIKHLIATEFAKHLSKSRIIEQEKTNTIDGVLIKSYFKLNQSIY